ncbi:alpha/beta fold hydrolase [Allokutzneria albata]|uniref:Alpha/beta hydrolase fold n=1 Tax=Allokutzneria albata TaxID=211114 RepID=A0A1G9U481_ALLAB|nr:alpha/beta fold hydrolase [Allokutzneria albata]SDM54484.1 alpha/beta hydrolase fold [Allokutzneria albata]
MWKMLLALTLLVPPTQQPRPLDWKPCFDSSPVAMQCADLAVPLAENGKRTITLKVARLPATGAGKGSVLANFGGPKGDQIAALRSRPQIFDKIRQSMDVITWDPRGCSGLSEPVLNCGFGFLRTPPLPKDRAEFDALAEDNRIRRDKCRANDPELYDHMDAGSDARDVEAIRIALGEKEMNFIGTSYGGVIAQSYARPFPQRVRAVYIDGSVPHHEQEWDRELDALMRRFFDQAAPGTEQRWRALLAKAAREPIPAGTARHDGMHLQRLGSTMAWRGPATWAQLATAIAAAEQGDASGFIPPGNPSPYPGTMGDQVKPCLDFPRPADHRELSERIERLNRIAPNTGASFGPASHGQTVCAGLPAPVNPPKPLPRRLPPMLGAGTWLDHGSTARVVDQVPGSRTTTTTAPATTCSSA